MEYLFVLATVCLHQKILAGNMQACGGVLHVSNARRHFQTPDENQDNRYDDRVSCSWTLATTPGNVILLGIQDFEIEFDGTCRYDNFSVYDGRDDTAPLYGTYCGNLDMGSNGQVPLKFRSSSYYLHITFISDDTVNGRGILATYLAIPDNLWKQWPDGDYSIPMSIYGCPEKGINKWQHGYINLTMPFNYPYELFSSYGDISQKNIDTYLVGPHGLYNLQINFCTKVANVAKRDLIWLPSTSIQEWPRGDFGVYATKRKSCPEGFAKENHRVAVYKGTTYVKEGFTAYVKLDCSSNKYRNIFYAWPTINNDRYCSLTFWTCSKQTQRGDVVGPDLREPFMVLSPTDGFESKQINYTFNGIKSSMEVIIEDLYIKRRGAEGLIKNMNTQAFNHWMFVPIDTRQLYQNKLGNEDMHKIWDEFEFQPDRTTVYGVSCP